MSTPTPSPRRWWALGALVLSVLVIGLDGTIINVALPTLADALGANNAQLQWIGGGYLLTFGALMLPAGVLGDRYGHKRLLLAGLALFGIASVAGMLVDTPSALIVVRTALGAAAAMIMPLSMAMLPKIFPAEELPKAIGAWTAAAAFGLPVGPLVGGWLLDNFWWGSIFVFNVPVVVLALWVSKVMLPRDTRNADARKLDMLGTVLGVGGITALVYGTIEVPARGWGNPVTMVTLIGGIVLLAGFVVRQRRGPNPLIDLKLFSDRGFTWGTISSVFVSFTLMGALFVVPQFFQAVFGVDAFGSGLRLLPLIGGLLVGAQLSEVLVTRLGHRFVIAAGLVVLAAGALVGATGTTTSGYGFTAVWLVAIGVGFGLSMVPATALVMGKLPAQTSGSGSSMLESLQQVGGVLGVAGLGSLLSSGYHARLSVDGLPGPAADAARDSVQGAVSASAELNNAALLASAQNAFMHGMSLVLIACGVIALVAAIPALAFLPGRSAQPAPEEEVVTPAQEIRESLV